MVVCVGGGGGVGGTLTENPLKQPKGFFFRKRLLYLKRNDSLFITFNIFGEKTTISLAFFFCIFSHTQFKTIFCMLLITYILFVSIFKRNNFAHIKKNKASSELFSTSFLWPSIFKCELAEFARKK